MKRQLLSLLSLCRRAGGLCSGGTACEDAVRCRKALLVIAGADASDNTKKRFSQKAFHYGVAYKETLTKEEIGRAIGVGETAVIAVTNGSFSGRILELIEAESNNVSQE